MNTCVRTYVPRLFPAAREHRLGEDGHGRHQCPARHVPRPFAQPQAAHGAGPERLPAARPGQGGAG
eukprot:4701788-Lingulodinium_polyedra.AAC.1